MWWLELCVSFHGNEDRVNTMAFLAYKFCKEERIGIAHYACSLKVYSLPSHRLPFHLHLLRSSNLLGAGLHVFYVNALPELNTFPSPFLPFLSCPKSKIFPLTKALFCAGEWSWCQWWCGKDNRQVKPCPQWRESPHSHRISVNIYVV